MKTTKLLKSILIPTLGISAIGTIAAVSTSCGQANPDPDIIHVTSVELDKTSATLTIGDTETLTATVLPENATDKSVTWSTSDWNVATVNQNGIVTAVGPGNAAITVKTNDGDKTAACVVEVSERTIHVSSVSLDKTSITLAAGDTETLTATVLPENATDKSVTWSTSDWNVAIVNQNGTVAAVGPGNATITVKTNDGKKIATCEVKVNKLDECIGVIANKNSTLTLKNNHGNLDLQYSIDNGASWSQYTSYLSINQGQTLYLKGNNPNGWSHSDSNYSCLSITGDVSIFGNVMGLLDNGAMPGEQGNITDIPCDYCFYDLFWNSTGITSVSGNFLPATTLTDYCYRNMFYQCSSLTTAPKLPATTLADSCYAYMFQGCTSLTTAPKLPATTLADSCYEFMFLNCTSLKSASKLPATSLTQRCYNAMFYKCSSLTTAPELPATTLAGSCYVYMFYGCRSLSSIKIGYEGNYDVNYFNSWTTGVADSGTFYYNGSQTAQDFKLPEGWKSQPF